MSKFRKKPVVIDAYQYLDTNVRTIHDFVGDQWVWKAGVPHIRTLEGDMTVAYGDWIIRGVQGEFYPCNPDIFEQTYEPVTEDTQ